MPRIPAPHQWETPQREPFTEYIKRWPKKYAHIPGPVIETWIHRHWRDFQAWRPLNPLEWKYELKMLSLDEIMMIGHVNDMMKQLDCWGDELFDGKDGRQTWIGDYMLKFGTTPSPIIVALNAGSWRHPRELK